MRMASERASERARVAQSVGRSLGRSVIRSASSRLGSRRQAMPFNLPGPFQMGSSAAAMAVTAAAKEQYSAPLTNANVRRAAEQAARCISVADSKTTQRLSSAIRVTLKNASTREEQSVQCFPADGGAAPSVQRPALSTTTPGRTQ